MSRSRKHVIDDILTSDPVPTDARRVGRVVESRGSNIMEVALESGDSILATIPARYSKKIWIKRGVCAALSTRTEER
jgi:translation initiation factor IF-1